MTQHTADVICRENFDSSAVYYSSIPMSFTSYDFPIFGYTFDCTGNETSLCGIKVAQKLQIASGKNPIPRTSVNSKHEFLECNFGNS